MDICFSVQNGVDSKIVFMEEFIILLFLSYSADTHFDASPTYTYDVKPIFASKCSQCHDSMGDKNWQKYENAFKYRFQIREKIILKDMPKGKEMPQEERDKIVKWVDTGAKK